MTCTDFTSDSVTEETFLVCVPAIAGTVLSIGTIDESAISEELTAFIVSVGEETAEEGFLLVVESFLVDSFVWAEEELTDCNAATPFRHGGVMYAISFLPFLVYH